MSIANRVQIEILSKNGLSQRSITRQLNIAQSSVSKTEDNEFKMKVIIGHENKVVDLQRRHGPLIDYYTELLCLIHLQHPPKLHLASQMSVVSLIEQFDVVFSTRSVFVHTSLLRSRDFLRKTDVTASHFADDTDTGHLQCGPKSCFRMRR